MKCVFFIVSKEFAIFLHVPDIREIKYSDMLGLFVVWSPHCGGNCRFATLLPHYQENTFATFFGVMKRLRPKDIPWVQIVDDINISILLRILLLFYFFHSFS